MKSMWKGALIGGAIGLGVVAWRTYQKDMKTSDAPEENKKKEFDKEEFFSRVVKVSATSAAIGAAVAAILESQINQTSKAKSTKKKKRKRKSKLKRMMRWTEMMAAATPILQSISDATDMNWSQMLGKFVKKAKRASYQEPESVVIPGPLGKVRFATMRAGSQMRAGADHMRTRVIRRPFRSHHNGRH